MIVLRTIEKLHAKSVIRNGLPVRIRLVSGLISAELWNAIE